MITIQDLQKITDNGGLTLKKGNPITYKTGYQVATEGKVTCDLQEVLAIVEEYEGDCGLWFSEGLWYVDKSHRVATKRQAVEEGIAYNQISVLKWADMSLLFCK